jgi:hypothetical protein
MADRAKSLAFSFEPRTSIHVCSGSSTSESATWSAPRGSYARKRAMISTSKTHRARNGRSKTRASSGVARKSFAPH